MTITENPYYENEDLKKKALYRNKYTNKQFIYFKINQYKKKYYCR